MNKYSNVKTEHYVDERTDRDKLIDEIGLGKVILTCGTDKGHKDGAERYCITDTGIVIVYNAVTGRMVTKLIARPGQLMRFYSYAYMKPPKKLLEIAEEHQRLGYNKV